MKFCSLSSGSSGNCIFAGTEHTSLLVDAGISGKKTEKALNTIGYTLNDIDGILVTHEHIDHIKGLGVLARKLGVPIYATRGTIEEIENDSRVGEIDRELFQTVKADREVVIGDMSVEPFSISHDAAEPVGFRITCGAHSCAVATDMGTWDDYTVRHLQNLDVALVEANHDVGMLEAGPYPYPLKMRIMSDRGHLSNEMSGRLLCRMLHDGMKKIILGHLSAENNYPALACETVNCEVTMSDTPYRAGDFPIEAAKRDGAGSLIEF